LAQQTLAGVFMNYSINDDLPASRPGYVVLLGAFVVIAGMVAIMLFKTVI
jgi:hypothetical protein